MDIQQFYLGGLGHQSYLVSDEDSGVAAVVDPRRDIEIYLEAAARAGVRITHVFETHIHNDYVSGAREFAERVGATIVNAGSAHLRYAYQGVADGDRVGVGALTFEALATPGHTPDHLSYAVYEPGADAPYAVFSGGSLLVGSVGRTDLVSPGMTLTLTRDQYHSVRRLLDTFPAGVRVYPTHGAGSFCGTSRGASAHASTVGQERIVNPVAHAADEANFVREQLASYGVYPRYYVYMHEINQRGPRVLGGVATVPPLAPATVNARLRDGVPLIDGRNREEFAREHVSGSLNIELDETFGTYVGWLLPFNAPLMLQIEDEDGRHEAVAQLLRIGYEQTQGYLEGGVAAWKAAGLPVASFERVDVPELYRRWAAHQHLAVLDVRDDQEWASGHIPGAQHIHVGDLPRHLNALPLDVPVATICASGHRAEIAASLVAATGRPVIAVQGGVPDWIEHGFPQAQERVAETSRPEAEHAHP